MKKGGYRGNEYLRWAILVTEAAGRKCMVCGSQKRVAAHHIWGWNEYPEFRFDRRNGFALCGSCHYQVHTDGYVKLEMKEIGTVTTFLRKCKVCGWSPKDGTRHPCWFPEESESYKEFAAEQDRFLEIASHFNSRPIEEYRRYQAEGEPDLHEWLTKLIKQEEPR